VDEDDDPRSPTEAIRVVHKRLREAQRAGMTLVEARLFAESDINVDELRHLVEKGCPAELLAKILV
jgi:hypothetical protein